MGDLMTRIKKPQKGWRIIRGGRGNYEVYDFDTKEERNAAGAIWAVLDDEDVLMESWSADHPQDDLNQGWALDQVAYAPGNEPVPDPRPRTSADQLKPGDHVDVWGYPDIDPSTGLSKFLRGTVEEITPLDGFLSLRIKMTGGHVAFCVPGAVAYYNEDA